MENVTELSVFIAINARETPLGEMISNGREIFFKYNTSFLDHNLEISPIKLKLTNQIVSAHREPFEGLFGVFADSLPDGWGKLLLDRKLQSKGINAASINPLTRLALAGSNIMGALTYKPKLSNDHQNYQPLQLDEINQQANQLIKGTPTEILDELFHLGGSSGGARPKILVGYNGQSNELIHGQEILPDNFEHWIIKFPSSFDLPDIATIEYAYYKMALDCGIEMSDSHLFTGQSGNSYFGTKRFDRKGNEKIHMHSAAGLMHDNFRLSTMDYGNLLDCGFRLEKDAKSYQKIFNLATFNLYAHNRDDHSKNFSFLMDNQGHWKLAPAYDLTFSHSSHGMHSTMYAGESQNPTSLHLQKLAQHFQIKNSLPIIDRVKSILTNWKHYAQKYGVSKESEKLISSVIQKQLSK